MTEKNKTKGPQKKGDEYNEIQERLAAAIQAVLDQQLATQDPPEALETYERLQEEGFSEKEAMGLLGHVVSREVAELVSGTGVLNLARYIDSLSKLPLPFTEPKGLQPTEEDLPL